jgi:hypothetical protein
MVLQALSIGDVVEALGRGMESCYLFPIGTKYS